MKKDPYKKIETPLMKSLRLEPEKTLSVIRLERIKDFYSTLSDFSRDFVYPLSDDLIEQIINIGIKKMTGFFNVQEMEDNIVCLFSVLNIEISRDKLKIHVLEKAESFSA